jgi:hypothetical protein
MTHAGDVLPIRRAGKYPHRLGNPRVPFGWAVKQGKIKGFDSVNKFGFCAAVGATPAETIWTVGGRYVYETAASKVNVKSGSVEDDILTVAPAPGTGAHTVQIYGLDAKYVEQNELITMNGQVDVVSSLSYLRLNRMVVRSAGTGGANAGAITAKDATNTRTMANISIGDNQTLMALWTVPADNDGHIAVFWAGSATAKTSIIDLVVRPFGEVFQVKRRVVLNASHEQNVFTFTEFIPEKSDVEVIGITTGGGGAISAGFDILYHHH